MPLGANKAAIMGVAGATAAGDVVLLSEGAFSNQASKSFTSGIDSTYGEYIFGFYNINPATDGAEFTCQFNVASGSGYNETITSTAFRSYHDEADASTAFAYVAASDQAQGTAFQELNTELGNGADESLAGMMHLFNPSSTTYVTHFISKTNAYRENSATQEFYVSGYVNATAAVTDVQFKMSSGNFDGEIKLWGVKN